MLTSSSFREALRHVALRVRGTKSKIVPCFDSQPRQSTAWGDLALYAANQKWLNHVCYTLVLNTGCLDSAVRLRAGSLCCVLIMPRRRVARGRERR